MTNRLRLPWQWRLLLIACLFPWTSSLFSQCDCYSLNGVACNGTANAGAINFSINYPGDGTIYVDNTCTSDLGVVASEVIITQPLGNSPDVEISGGYTVSSMVPAGETVTFSYYYSGVDSDTLCVEISFVDTISPQLNVNIPDITVDCESADFTQWWQDQLDLIESNRTDNCEIDTIYHGVRDSFIDNCGSVSDTFFVVDIFGNTTTTSAVYTIIDSEAPSFINFPADINLACDEIVPSPPSVDAMDNCAPVVTAIMLMPEDTTTSATGACANYQYEIRRTWIVTDGCGNTTDSTQVIYIDDTEGPTFNAPADITILCTMSTDPSSTGNISNLDDNCSPTGDIVVTMSQVTAGGSCTQEKTITRIWLATDVCDNTRSKSQTITVIDTLAPVVIFPADITVSCFDDRDESITGVPDMSDNCDANPSYSDSDLITAGACEHSAIVERTWLVVDECGNDTMHVQVITIIDTIPPVINDAAVDQTITCDVDIDAAFNNWVNMHGAATATDNCAVVGDTLQWSAYIAGTSIIAALPGPDCANPTSEIFREVSVDFIVEDKCGNTDTTTAVFSVADNDPPVIVNCPTDITVNVDPGQCDRVETLLLPQIMENCGNSTSAVNLSISETPTIPAGSDPVETPIDDLVFNFNVNGPPYSVSGNATLTIVLDNIDAEEPTEYLLVYGENGDLIGTVANTPVQCGDTVTTINITGNLIDAWAYDGILTITVKPNIPASLAGRFSVNPICPNSLVTATLEYDSDFPTGLGFEYSLDSGARNTVLPLAPFDEVFAQGTHTVDYYFTDCADNESTCSYKVTVEDNEAPTIDCPPSDTISLDAGLCDKEVIVPLFTNVSDNCSVTTPNVQELPADSIASLLTYSYNPNLGDFVADDKSFTFSGLLGNATPGGVKLIIEIQGDVDSVGEYFRVFANGLDLGTTAKNQAHAVSGNCNTPSTAIFVIPASTFNDWASNGDIIVEAVSFMNFPIPPAGPSWGINPCDTTQVHNDGDTDGSYIKATFSYESVMPTFSASGATTITSMTLTPPLEADTFLLKQGTTTFNYSVTDLAGNIGDCSFDIRLEDVELPKALCGPAFVDINPSGFDVDTVYAAEIDLGSSDNCSITSMVVTPSVFDCDDQGTNPVTLTVTDASGNVSVCSTFVNVTTQQPAPTAGSPCGTGNLQLFANPPASSAGNNVIYNYTWLNPAGVPFAFVQNPVIQDADISDIGFYTVVIEGVTFCESMSSVQVTCEMLPLQQPLLQTPNNSVCTDETINLTTSSVCGNGVKYKWYTGPVPGVLMGITTQPNFTYLPPSSGNYSFYVIVERNGCNSEFSDEIGIQVNAAPTASVNQTNVLVCEGEEVILKSINVPQGASCHWTGPCGYESFNCSPGAISSITSCNSGIYELVVTLNGCPSQPDTTFVNVVDLPTTPSVSNTTSANNPACDGEPVTLTATPVAGAVSYEWTTPMFTKITTNNHILTMPSSDILKDAGTWTVKVNGNTCVSLVSAPTTVFIEPLPESITSAITPTVVCEGQDVQLSASSATPNVSYEWVYPNSQGSALPDPILTNVSDQNDGTYQVTVTTQFGCTAMESLDLEVLDRVDITAVSDNAPDCISGAVNVQLVATLFPIDNGSYQYKWTGPNGYISTDPSAIISGADTNDNGPYNLVVTNSNGCSSLPATVNVEIPSILPTPIIENIASHCEGENATLEVVPYNGGNAEYVWITPNTTITTTSPKLPINDLELSDAGNYSVNYVVDGCFSPVSGSISLEVNAIPFISPNSNSPVCEGDVIELDVDCSAGSYYEWFGPGSFGSAVCNPIIVNADTALHAGTYSIRKQVDGCWSDVETINIIVKKKPALPTAFNTGPYCADTENVTLSVTTGSGTPGATYTWYDSDSGMQLGNNTPALNFPIPNAGTYNDGEFRFHVIADLDGCKSAASFETEVTINTIPANIAEAGPHVDACDGNEVFLIGTVPSIGTGFWTSAASNPPGVTIFNPDEADTEVEGLIVGETYTFEWTLSNGACTDYSTDETTIFVNMLEDANAGDAITVCEESIVTLNGNVPMSNDGHWSQPLSQERLGITIIDPNDPNTAVTGLEPNQYIFTWTIDGGCGASSDDVIVEVVLDENANGGIDFEDCGDGSTVLDATPAESGDGAWSSPDPNIDFTSVTDPLTSAMNLQEGMNTLIWSIDNDACGLSTDTVFVDYQMAPISFDDLNNFVAFAGNMATDVTANDMFLTNFFTIEIINGPFHGEATVETDGVLTYNAEVNFIGADSLQYEVCVQACECARATVHFTVGKDAECYAPSIITPNGDGMNDGFVIPCLAEVDSDGQSGFPSNSVSIYNQWGDEVYNATPYQNDWRGTFNGDDLPAGTYFYIIDLGNGDKPMSGYLIIQR